MDLDFIILVSYTSGAACSEKRLASHTIERKYVKSQEQKKKMFSTVVKYEITFHIIVPIFYDNRLDFKCYIRVKCEKKNNNIITVIFFISEKYCDKKYRT